MPSTTQAGPARTARERAAFGVVAVVLGAFLAAASAPSPLYALYAQRWGFSPTTLTAVFAVYAGTLLVALLTTGTLSDALGRRPVVLGALGLQEAAMALFLAADGVGWLLAARLLQGLATGVVTAALAAWLLDAEPPERPGLGALLNTAVPATALALGALGSGVLAQYGPAPLTLVYAVLLAVFAVAAGAVATLPEPVAGRRAPDLRPRVGLAPGLRGPFLAVLPCLVATWGLGGFYLSLGPSLVLSLAGTTDRLLGAAAVCLLTGSGAATSVTLRRLPPARALVHGCLALVVGVAVSLVGVGAGSSAWFLAGSAVAGAGFGLGFLGAFRTLAALPAPGQRAALISTMYVANYLAFSVPAIAAGAATTTVGLRAAALGYGAVVAVLALVAVVLTGRRRRDPVAPLPPGPADVVPAGSPPRWPRG